MGDGLALASTFLRNLGHNRRASPAPEPPVAWTNAGFRNSSTRLIAHTRCRLRPPNAGRHKAHDSPRCSRRGRTTTPEVPFAHIFLSATTGHCPQGSTDVIRPARLAAVLRRHPSASLPTRSRHVAVTQLEGTNSSVRHRTPSFLRHPPSCPRRSSLSKMRPAPSNPNPCI